MYIYIYICIYIYMYIYKYMHKRSLNKPSRAHEPARRAERSTTFSGYQPWATRESVERVVSPPKAAQTPSSQKSVCIGLEADLPIWLAWFRTPPHSSPTGYGLRVKGRRSRSTCETDRSTQDLTALRSDLKRPRVRLSRRRRAGSFKSRWKSSTRWWSRRSR